MPAEGPTGHASLEEAIATAFASATEPLGAAPMEPTFLPSGEQIQDLAQAMGVTYREAMKAILGIRQDTPSLVQVELPAGTELRGVTADPADQEVLQAVIELANSLPPRP